MFTAPTWTRSGAPAGNMNRELRGYQDFLNGSKPHEASLSEANARRLLTALDSNGLRDHTIVVLWGDHGWKLGEHNGWGKMTNYEIDARVPLIVRAPGYQSGQRQGMVEFVNVYPTLRELAGIKQASNLEGRTFVPLLQNPKRKGKSAIFHQFLREGIRVYPDGVESMGYAIRTERHRYVDWLRWKDKTLAEQEL